MEKQHLFSIIVPVYNVEDCLERCISSLVQQDFPEEKYEIILVDDGSGDSSGSKCDGYSEAYANVKAFHKENGGLSSARNYGVDRADGKYVLFVDSDDYLERNTCRRLSEALTGAGPVDAVVYNGVEEHGLEKHILRHITEEKVFDDGKAYMLEQYRDRGMNVEAWLYLYRRKYLDQNRLRFREGILHEDVEFTPRALLPAGRVMELPDLFYHYVVREDSISTRKDQTKNIQDLFQTLK